MSIIRIAKDKVTGFGRELKHEEDIRSHEDRAV